MTRRKGPYLFKRRKIDYGRSGDYCLEETDRLSALPDAILTNILSLLPFETAVSTSILSHRWRTLWTQITSLRATQTSLDQNIFAVANASLGRLTSHTTDTFQLYSITPPSNDKKDIFYSLMHRICARQVKEIHLSFNIRNFHYDSTIPIPPCVFKCQSLEVLKFGSIVDLKLPRNGVCLPNLRQLHLCGCELSHRELMENLSKSCPLLKDLHLYAILTVTSKNIFRISASNLKRLTMDMRGMRADDHVDKKDSTVIIDTPKLQHFSFESSACLTPQFASTPIGLSTACMSLGFWWNGPEINPRRALDVLEPLYNVQYLNVRGHKLFNGMAHYLHQDDLDLPVFYHLTTLNVDIQKYYPEFWNDILCFLNCCPGLQVLTVKLGCLRQNIEEKCKSRSRFETNQPVCLLSKVKKISVQLLFEAEYVVEQICYILRISKVLETYNISFSPNCRYSCRNLQLNQELDFCHKLYATQQSHSLTCQINFSGHYLKVSREGMIIRASNAELDTLLALSNL